jgi:hypothetical protein
MHSHAGASFHKHVIVTLIIMAFGASTSYAEGITDISQVVIGNIVKSELDRLVKSVEISEVS